MLGKENTTCFDQRCKFSPSLPFLFRNDIGRRTRKKKKRTEKYKIEFFL